MQQGFIKPMVIKLLKIEKIIMKTNKPNIVINHIPNSLPDRFAMILFKALRWIADSFFKNVMAIERLFLKR